MEAHLASCETCAALRDDLRRSRELLDRLWCAAEAQTATVTPSLAGADLVPSVHVPAARQSPTLRDTAAKDGAPAVRGRSSSVRWAIRGLATAAAVLLVGVTLTWTGQDDRAPRSETPTVVAHNGADEADAAAYERLRERVEAEGMAARLLAAADSLRRAKGGAAYAAESYRFIAKHFPATAAGELARRQRSRDPEPERTTP